MDVKQRLYYFDSEQRTFEAQFLAQSARGDGLYEVILSQSAFYPTSGGQPHDTGVIDGVEVADVFVRGDEVVHVLASALPTDSALIHGEINWQRRFDHMQQHCGQHILSAAFEQLFDLDTIGFHLGDVSATLDIDAPSLDADVCRQAESLANQVIWEDREITARFVETEGVPAFRLRHAPKVNENIRIVSIDGFDHNACGGTHPKRTGQVGLIKVVKQEKMRAGTRLTFLCGGRALADYGERCDVLQKLANQLSAGVTDMPASVLKLQQNLADWRKLARAQLERVCTYYARELMTHEQALLAVQGYLVHKLPTCADMAEFKEMFKAVKREMGQAAPDAALILMASVSGRVHVQGESTGVPDIGAVLRDTLENVGGKAGGSAKSGQGSAPETADHDAGWFHETLNLALQNR